MGIKPQINVSDVNKLFEKLNIEGKNIKEIGNGQIAKTYEFQVEEKRCFIQFNEQNMSQGTINELIFAHDFKVNHIPLRKMIGHGDYLGFSYIITEKILGKAFDNLSKEEFLRSIVDMMNVLYRISETDINRFSGYGWLDEEGNGKSESWEDHLSFIYKEEPGFFYGNWFELFDTSFLERDRFELYYEKMKDQFRFLPDIRKLIHSGFCGGNILFDKSKVTGVLDWQDARYGDPLYDLAYMVFWMNDEDAARSLLEYTKAFKLDASKDNFDQRLKCYKYYIGLDCMRYSAKIGNKEFYDYIIRLMEKI